MTVIDYILALIFVSLVASAIAFGGAAYRTMKTQRNHRRGLSAPREDERSSILQSRKANQR